jgi:hypothetical protein
MKRPPLPLVDVHGRDDQGKPDQQRQKTGKVDKLERGNPVNYHGASRERRSYDRKNVDQTAPQHHQSYKLGEPDSDAHAATLPQL